MSLDLAYSLARPVMARQAQHIILMLVGCGGNGSQLAPHLARIACELQRQGKVVSLYFFDGDIVERGNIGRSNFCDAEIGLHKATTLAARYGGAYGLPIVAVPEPIAAERLRHPPYDALTVMIGCVDRASGRQELAAMLRHNQATAPRVWWLDLNNDALSGRVLLGNTAELDHLRHAFDTPLWCTALPAPQLVYPDQLTPRPEEGEDHTLSCQQLQEANAQSLGINSLVAAVGAQYLIDLLLTHQLRCFTTTISATSFVAQSRYTTPQSIATAIGQPTLYAPVKTRKRRRA